MSLTSLHWAKVAILFFTQLDNPEDHQDNTKTYGWIIQSTVHKGGEGRREIGGCPAAPWETRMWEQVAVIFPPIMIIVTDYDGCHDCED